MEHLHKNVQLRMDRGFCTGGGKSAAYDFLVYSIDVKTFFTFFNVFFYFFLRFIK